MIHEKNMALDDFHGMKHCCDWVVALSQQRQLNCLIAVPP
jgi:hypothetical protein